MKTIWRVYRLTADGWRVERKAQSFAHACRLCRELADAQPLAQFCVNTY